MIHVTDSLLPSGEVWPLDFLSLYFYLYLWHMYSHFRWPGLPDGKRVAVVGGLGDGSSHDGETWL